MTQSNETHLTTTPDQKQSFQKAQNRSLLWFRSIEELLLAVKKWQADSRNIGVNEFLIQEGKRYRNILNPFFVDLDKFIPKLADSPLLYFGFEVITMPETLPEPAISFGRSWFLRAIYPEYPEWKRHGFHVWMLEDRLFVSDICLSCTILIGTNLTIQAVQQTTQSIGAGDLRQLIDLLSTGKGFPTWRI